ncbi:MAG TPA: hypothetical protein DHV07_04815 [Flavobacteriales bacterium]|jgi:hypothetical protein|nr:hypothetical protein [Flavobacteriales bacterium]
MTVSICSSTPKMNAACVQRLVGLVLWLLATASIGGVWAQAGATDEGEQDAPATVFTHRYEAGITLHTRGMGGIIERGKYRGVGKLSTWSVGFASMKHAKEVRSFNPAYDQAKSYVFGKVNALYILRLGWGKRTVATPKLRNGGVSIGWHYSFGAALGLTKPVYLEIGYPQIPYTYLLTQRYDPSEHGTNDIYGRAGAMNGILELTPHPGAYFRAAADFEYGRERETLRMLSVGIQVDAFPTRVVIMAEEFGQNDRLYLTLFAHWTLGRQKFKT